MDLLPKGIGDALSKGGMRFAAKLSQVDLLPKGIGDTALVFALGNLRSVPSGLVAERHW